MSRKTNKQRALTLRSTKHRARNRKLQKKFTLLGVEQLEPRRVLATFTVNTLWDGTDQTTLGDGNVDASWFMPGNQITLRAAIQEANALAGEDTIILPMGINDLSITGANEDSAATGDLDITEALRILGNTSFGSVVDANGIDRVFHVMSDVTLTLANVTLTGGDATVGTLKSGGGILNDDGNVTMIYGVLDDNTASDGGGAANLTGGTFDLLNITFSNNTATDDGGGLFASAGTVTITNSTFSGNSADSDGGGIMNDGATISLRNGTVADNSANQNGGGIRRASGSVSVGNSIIATNTASTDVDVSGSFTSLGYNLIGDVGNATGFTDSVNGDQVGDGMSPIDPVLGPLQDNGGPSFTHALLPSSPAIDAGSSSVYAGPTTLLNGSINATQTTLTIDDTVILPATTFYHVQLDNEVMRVRSVSGNTLTVVRGINGTTAASHSDDTTVKLLVAQRGERRFTDGIDANTTVTVDIGGFEFGTFFVNCEDDATDDTTLGDGRVDANACWQGSGSGGGGASGGASGGGSGGGGASGGASGGGSGGGGASGGASGGGSGGGGASGGASGGGSGSGGASGGGSGSGGASGGGSGSGGGGGSSSGSGSGNPAGDQVTLRAAIQELNALAGVGPMDGIIEFSPRVGGEYELTINGGGEDSTATGDLDTEGELTLNGRGKNFTIIGTALLGSALQDRVFHVQPDTSLILYGLYVTGGHVTNDNGAGILNEEGSLELGDSAVGSGPAMQHAVNATNQDGGGIYNVADSEESGGVLYIAFSDFFQNEADRGGAIFSESGTVTIIESVVGDNEADDTGGGIHIESGTVTIIDSEFRDQPDGGNTANEGGAIYLASAVTGTISGTSVESNYAAYHGAGIYNAGDLVINSGSEIANNETNGSGAGIYNSGTMEIDDSSIMNNQIPAGGNGAGIFNANGGDIDITDSSIYYNLMVAGDSAGLYNEHGDVSVINSTFYGNRAQNSVGSINNHFGRLTIVDSTFDSNSADFLTAGVFNFVGIMDVTRSTFSDNTVEGGGDDPGITYPYSNHTFTRYRAGAISTWSYTDITELDGGVNSSTTTLYVDDASVFAELTLPRYIRVWDNYYKTNVEYMKVTAANASSNTLTVVRGIDSTAISHSGDEVVDLLGGDLSLINSTISGNSIGPAWYSEVAGGGIHINNSRPNLEGNLAHVIEFSTITQNEAYGYGGGVSTFGEWDDSCYSYGGTTNVYVRNTIIAENTANESPTCPETPDPDPSPDVYGGFISNGHNLIGEIGEAYGFTHNVNGDQVGNLSSPIDPDLGPLQDNGGPTFTHALDPNSPAVDAGDNTDAPATDQRGEDRIHNYVVDIGAYEYQGESLMGSLFVPDLSSLNRSTGDLRSQATNAVNVALATWGESLGRAAPLNVRVEIANLNGAQLAAGEILRRDELGNPVMGRIIIDSNAAGLLWHTDPSALPASGSYDLYRVVLHEVGHVLGFEHSTVNDVMNATLKPASSPLTVSLRDLHSDDLYQDLLSPVSFSDADSGLVSESSNDLGNLVEPISRRSSRERSRQIAVTQLSDRETQLAVDAILEEYDLLCEMKKRKGSTRDLLEAENQSSSDNTTEADATNPQDGA